MTERHNVVLPASGPRTAGEGRVMTPLQAELLDEGVVPDPDGLGPLLSRHDLAIGAGYGDGGPARLPGPESPAPADEEDRWPPVLQWQIDPHDAALPSGETDVTLGGWDFAIWWQHHPSGLLYASIQALQHDPDITPAAERELPLGRNVVVNLVYDEHRQAVVAIYGTARDFRPFVSAFCIGLGLKPPPGEQTL